MTHHEWLTSTDPAAMLAWLQGGYRHKATGILSGTVVNEPRRISDRKLRLFAVACCRAVWDRLTDPRSRRAVEVAERFTDGLATDEELEVAEDNARRSWESSDNPAGAARYCCISSATHGAQCIARPHMRDLPPPDTQAAILRTIIGDPFNPVTLCGRARKPFHNQYAHVSENGGFWLESECGDCQRIRTPDVLAIASRIYDTRDWDAMPMLADALETSGCEDARVLEWLRGDVECVACRGAGVLGTGYGSFGARECQSCSGTGRIKPVRCRGDWCLDLVLGRE